MKQLSSFFEQAEAEQRAHYNWRKKAAPLLGLALGISISALVGGIISTASSAPSAKTLEFWVIVVASGAVSGFFSFIIMNGITSWFLAKHAELTKVAQELEFFRRAGDKLGAFMFFVKESNFDKTLDWFYRMNSRSLNMVIAQVIKEQLDRAFEHTSISIPINTYADHSNVLARLLPVAENVCFTCIKSPKTWFQDLDKDYVEHDVLPSALQTKVVIKTSGLPDYSEERIKKYPTHYIYFLILPRHDVVRRRVFLLKKPDWDDLLNKEHYAFFRKFVDPCKDIVETLFVDIEKFKNIITMRASNPIRAQILKAIEENVLQKDYDIFEQKAMLVFDPKPTGAPDHPTLEFHVGEKVNIYARFLDIVFSLGKKRKEYGVYTVEEVEELIEERSSTEEESASDEDTEIASNDSGGNDDDHPPSMISTDEKVSPKTLEAPDSEDSSQ